MRVRLLVCGNMRFAFVCKNVSASLKRVHSRAICLESVLHYVHACLVPRGPCAFIRVCMCVCDQNRPHSSVATPEGRVPSISRPRVDVDPETRDLPLRDSCVTIT